MSGYYTAAVKFKEEWWNCNDAVIKSVEEKKVLSEVAYILFYKQMYRYFQTKISYNVFGQPVDFAQMCLTSLILCTLMYKTSKGMIKATS